MTRPADRNLEFVNCPYCKMDDCETWASERGFTTVRCRSCGFLYLNPRPVAEAIEAAVRTGVHDEYADHLDVTSRRVNSKVARYRQIFSEMFDDVWRQNRPISWLDVGAGYGEVLEAVASLAPQGSRIEGLEPMRPKAEAARRRGFIITEDYLRPTHARVGFISAIDVFSHVPDFDSLLKTITEVLERPGELFLETGNLADIENRTEFPGDLGLPDHVTFAGERHLRGHLERHGFRLERLQRVRIDGWTQFAKNVVKRAIGRPVVLRLPYTSNYRQLLVRATLQ